MNNINTPYNDLNPSLILDAVENLGFKCSGSLLALNSYENRVYQIGIEDSQPLIAKFYRPYRWESAAIIEEHQFATELAAHEIPVIAPMAIHNNHTLHEHKGFRFALFPRKGGRALELENLEQLEWVGRFIGRLHAVGNCARFQHRIQIDTHSYGHNPYQFLLNNNFIPDEIKKDYCETVETILKKIESCFETVGEINYLRLHGDCHAGNILWNDSGPQIVDLDDCLTGPAIQDIWMLIAGHTQDEANLQLQKLLLGYRKFHDFNNRELQLIEPLRSLRMIHYSGWLAKRWEDPAFPLHFPWFNSLSYWKQQLQNLHEQRLLLEKKPDRYL